jgi:hypothetical protein
MTTATPPDQCQPLSESAPRVNRELFSPNLRVEFVDPLCDPDWDRLVTSHPDFTFFHTSAWAKVLCDSYRHKPFYLYFSQQGESVALLPLMEVRSPFTGRRGVCLPFSDFCEPLLFGHGSEHVIDKLSELAQERNWKYFEVRGGRTLQAPAAATAVFYEHKLDLRSGAADLRKGFLSSTRRAINKAERSELRVEVSTTREAMLAFYRLHVQTRKRHGLPPQPISFFLNIHENITKTGLGFVVLAYRGSCAVAAAVFLHFGKKAIYKYGASDKRFQEYRGNNLVMWEGIRFLAQNDAETLHFGRTSLDNDGLSQFKLSWGTQEELIEYFRFDPVRSAWITARGNASKFHNKLFARFPLALNSLVGAMVYPHLD